MSDSQLYLFLFMHKPPFTTSQSITAPTTISGFVKNGYRKWPRKVVFDGYNDLFILFQQPFSKVLCGADLCAPLKRNLNSIT